MILLIHFSVTGTNDKAGAVSYLQKWVSPMSVKETTAPYTEWSYPSVDQ
jgi:1-pyrroline-5-carboxylate dehydrogenase